MLRVEGVETYYGAIQALKGISLEVREGEIVTLIGANGAGKSTTLRSINGLNHPRRGTIGFRGGDITNDRGSRGREARASPSRRRGARLFPRMTVTENLEMGAFQRTDRSGAARRTWTASSRSSRGSPSGATRRRGRCPAASSRCARSAAR